MNAPLPRVRQDSAARAPLRRPTTAAAGASLDPAASDGPYRTGYPRDCRAIPSRCPMPSSTLPKQEVLDRLTAAFRQFGYDGASLARLSKATGLGRSSLYHYFPNGKEDMAAAVLANAGARFEETVLAPLRAKDAPPRERLTRMVAGLAAFYAD